MATKAQSAFLAALTATDQIAPGERKRLTADARQRAKRELRGDRYEAWMLATASYHRAMAAATIACCARVEGWPDAKELSTEEIGHAAALVAATDRLMALPLQNTGDLKERQVIIRQWGKAARVGAGQSLWRQATQRWTERLERLAAEGC